MFNTQNSSPSMSIKNELPFRDKYPNFKVFIEQLSVQVIPEDSPVCFLKLTHDLITINETSLVHGTFKGVIHKGFSCMLKGSYTYRIWFSRPDNFDRYLEILNVERL